MTSQYTSMNIDFPFYTNKPQRNSLLNESPLSPWKGTKQGPWGRGWSLLLWICGLVREASQLMRLAIWQGTMMGSCELHDADGADLGFAAQADPSICCQWSKVKEIEMWKRQGRHCPPLLCTYRNSLELLIATQRLRDASQSSIRDRVPHVCARGSKC